MKKATVLVIGLICIVLFGFSTKAGRSGDGIHNPSDSLKTIVAREWEGASRRHALTIISNTSLRAWRRFVPSPEVSESK